ncbi:hypothetical protein HWV62_29907 [Athelia sp. TMB]|nr:hypothetical protein HWV62_29907 [Athelia sp. TMB]
MSNPLPPHAYADAKSAPPARLAAATASAHFALALRLSNLRATCAPVPPGTRRLRASRLEALRLGGKWGVPRGRVVDRQLVGGAVLNAPFEQGV